MCANERGDSFSLSLWFQPARDLANVLVTREVASVSVDLHLIQRTEHLFEDRPSGSLVSPGKSSCQVPRFLVFFSFYLFIYFFLLLSFTRTDVTRLILVRTEACESQ